MKKGTGNRKSSAVLGSPQEEHLREQGTEVEIREESLEEQGSSSHTVPCSPFPVPSLKRDYKNRLKLKVNDKIIYINEDLFNLDIQYTLSPFYKERLVKLCKDNNLTEHESLSFLLDYYYLDNAANLKLVSKQISYRLFQGVDKSFIIYLRNLYTVLGHFLKKLRYI